MNDDMRDDVRKALDINVTSTMEDRTVDITTIGRRSRTPRRIEICFYRYGDAIYLSGIPSPRVRDWLANLQSTPEFTFHLKHHVHADLPAVATVISEAHERRRIMATFVDEFNLRHGPNSEWPKAVLEEWVERSPLAKVEFVEES